MIELGFDFQAMASPCALRLMGADEATLTAGARAAIAEVRRIEHTYSRYRSDSIVSCINGAAGSGSVVTVDAETAALLDFAAQLHVHSGGLFDITSGVLRRAWDFRSGRLPQQAEIDRLLPLIGWPQVHWNGRAVALPRAGMEIDFGGFGKEYAADRLAALLPQHGVHHGYVNLGGDIRIIGPQPSGSGWRLGIRDPRDTTAWLDQVDITAGALATSGNYERCIVVDGVRHGHILDPRSGWPARHWQSVSVLAPTCAAAGAACTTVVLMGEAGLDFLRRQGLPYIGIRHDGSLVRG